MQNVPSIITKKTSDEIQMKCGIINSLSQMNQLISKLTII